MSYILKHFDTELMRFDLIRNIEGIDANILSVREENVGLLPLDVEAK